MITPLRPPAVPKFQTAFQSQIASGVLGSNNVFARRILSSVLLTRALLSVLLLPLSVLLLPVFTGIAEAQTKYLGAASCASSNCHGSASPRTGTNVRQNEYTTWFKNEAHVQAYKVLSKPESKTIAKHLGIGNPEQATLCLKCHSTHIEAAAKGPKFRVQDGVSCESCHGAAEKYIQSHTAKDSTHSGNVKNGMIDMVNLQVRATVCMECHYGTDNQVVDHRLIGAGHPRLTYELDTYGVLQPNHWEIDSDYVKRKGAYSSARAWFSGQVARAVEQVAQLRSAKRSKFGALPELTMFTCYQCHHSLTEEQWKSRSYGGHPGELHLNLSSLQMVAEGLQVLDSGTAKQLKDKIATLNSAFAEGSQAGVLGEIDGMLKGSVTSIASSASYNAGTASQLIKQLGSYCSSAAFVPYEVAEQCAMGVSALALTADPSGKVYQSKIDGVYDTLKNEKTFQPGPFTKAMQRM